MFESAEMPEALADRRTVDAGRFGRRRRQGRVLAIVFTRAPPAAESSPPAARRHVAGRLRPPGATRGIGPVQHPTAPAG